MDNSTGDKRLIVMGDRVLIAPDEGDERTEVGLYLPRSVMDREAVQGGRVVAKGPGLPLIEPGLSDSELWQESHRDMKHLPMQVEVGDYTIFLRKASVEIKYDGKRYLVVPQSALLLLLRDGKDDDDSND